MKILWFSVTPSMYSPHSNGHNGGGWIASLEQIVRGMEEVELGIAFNYAAADFKCENEGVTYYPMPTPRSGLLKSLFRGSGVVGKLEHWLRVVEDFKPDIIQIFGSENEFGLLIPHVNVPVVIHMQGCMPPYENASMPVGLSRRDFLTVPGLTLRERWMGWRTAPAFKATAEREIQVIQSCRYFMGRTAWDRNLVSLFNPAAQYYHCEEALRDSFLQMKKRWQYQEREKISIISVISRPWYKGQDLILKTAALLKRFSYIDFEWNVYGIPHMRFFENKYGIKAADVNVNVRGTASKEQLVDALCDASCYVHTSYIDNSPNSLCEAQMLGVPVLATHVGGISSLVKDGETGILYPANAPYDLASAIVQLSQDQSACERMSQQERQSAETRHNPEAIRATLHSIYRYILKS